MAPRKPTLSRSSRAVVNGKIEKVSVQAEDQRGANIIDFLTHQTLPLSANDGRWDSHDESQPKRQKTLSDNTFYNNVIVNRSSLIGTFPNSKPSQGNALLERSDAPARVTIDRLPEISGAYRIKIWDISGQDSREVLHDVVRAENVAVDDIQLALLVASETGRSYNPIGQGRLWTQVDIRLGIKEGIDYLAIDFTVRWNVTNSFKYIPSRIDRSLLQTIIHTYFLKHDNLDENQETWSPQEFYRSVHVPEKEDSLAASIVTSQLDSHLYPFQKRSLRWLLQREGKRPSDAGRTILDLPDGYRVNELPYSFQAVVDAAGQPCYVSPLLQVITLDVEPYRTVDNVLKGGILAEEMGLGKTVEIIALISLHKRQLSASGTIYDPYISELVRESSATLIITPPSILSQWKSELAKHAPALEVMHYEGVKHKISRKLGEKALLEKFVTCDVVLATYDVIGKEIHFTIPPPDRYMRRGSKYERARSPLLQLSWWRICLDEAQMIESGVSNAARVARSIPRINAWGITGTPIKRDVADLLGLLIFLRFEPLDSRPNLWYTFITHHRLAFKQLFSEISLRHTKEFVRDELRLPPQKRFVITMPFTPVEEQHYQSLFQEMCDEVGVDRDGAPTHEHWDPNSPYTIRLMKTWLNRLRQTTLHPEVGPANRRYLGRRDGPMRTVEEVLAAMLEQSESVIRADQRALLVAKLKRGQAFENGPLVKEALAVWTDVLNVARGLVTNCRDQIRKETVETSGRSADVTDTSADEIEMPLDRSSSESVSKLGLLRNRLRAALEIEHMATFFQANAFFQIKSNPELTEPDSEAFKELEDKEVNGYETAKKLRQELLKDVFQKADKRMKKLAKCASSQRFADIPDFSSHPSKGGIESRRILDQLHVLAMALNRQANQLDEWRETSIQLLLRPLVDDESNGADITGEEYENSTKTQDEVMVYVQALRAMIEDRHDALTGQDNILISSDVKTAIRLAKAKDGAFPERVLELLAIRGKLKPVPGMGSVRVLVAELRALANALKIETETGSGRAAAELVIVEVQRVQAQKQFNDQMKAITALRQEIDEITALMNARLEFYRALQTISDMVAPLDILENDKTHFIRERTAEEIKLSQKIATASAKHRYLIHLRDEADEEQQRMCVICQGQFEQGSLTVCGHQFCKDCILLWWRAHHSCPICKKVLMQRDLHDITYRPQELKVVEETASALDRSTSKKSSIYSDINSNSLSQIKQIELNGVSFTTKVDTLMRHLIWLRETDPGAQTVVFSQYKEFIDVLRRALTAHRIGYVAFGDKESIGGVERFKQDRSIECFLLHARAHSSGLNLVNASHVILCEPLVNTAIELQAIARVDRIGQQQETTVWLYLVDGTVEQSIHEISVRRRMEHMIGRNSRKGKEKEQIPDIFDSKMIEAANSRELQNAGSVAELLSKEKAEGENVQNDDLWACLFGSRAGKAKAPSKEVEGTVRRHLQAETEAVDQRRVEESNR